MRHRPKKGQGLKAEVVQWSVAHLRSTKTSLKMRPMVFGINCITYSLAIHLVDMLKPLVGKSKTDIQNSKDLVDKLVEVEIEGDILTSFDVTALFTSVPGKEVVEITVKRANKDPTWYNRTLVTLMTSGSCY